MSSAPSAPSTPSRRTLLEEVLVVLSLSLLASAVFSIIDLLSGPLAGGVVAVFPVDLNLARQLASFLFGLAPVALVLHLVRRSGEGTKQIGLGTATLGWDIGWGVVLGAAVALVGLTIYLASIRLRVNRFVIPVPPLGHWWTVPILGLDAAQAALIEEVIVVAYLIRRLEQIGWSGNAAVGTSAVLRGAYHLYQGWGGFTGNLILGLVFASAYRRWRRTWPLVTAHFLLDFMAGVGYILFRGDCFFRACIR